MPVAPKPEDFTRTISAFTRKVAGEEMSTFEVPLSAKLVGVLDEDGAANLLFVIEGESEEFAAAAEAYQAEIDSIVVAAREAGYAIYSYEDVEKYVNGELDKPTANEQFDFLSVLSQESDDE